MMGECVEYMNLLEVFRRCDVDRTGIVQWAELLGILYSPFDMSSRTGQKYLKRYATLHHFLVEGTWGGL